VNSTPPPSQSEVALIELARWLARALQYTPQHPLSVQLGARTHEALARALREWTPLEAGVLRDKLTIGATQARHPALLTRFAPYLHERGVVVLRFIDGVTIAELSALVEVLARPPAQIFEAGGLRSMLTDRRVAHVQVDEIAHELTIEDRERIRKEDQLRELFREMLMRLLSQGHVAADLGAHIAELAEHPDLAVRVIQSEPHVNLAEAVAGFTVILMQEEQRRGEALLERMGPILMQLSPESRSRVLLGFPPLVGDFRHALASAFGVLDESQLARFAFPCLRAHAADLEATLYALGLASPSDERRIETARRLAGLLYDLNLDEAGTLDVVRALAGAPEEAASFASERTILSEAARRIVGTRVPLHRHGEDELLDAQAFAATSLESLAQRTAYDVVIRSARMVDFDKFCERLPSAARSLSGEERAPAVAGILLGLAAVTEPRWKEVAGKALAQISRSGVGALAVRSTERLAGPGEDAPIDDILLLAQLVGAHNPEPVLDVLERASSRKLRRALIDLLASVGPSLLSSVQTRMHASQWYVTRNMIILHARLGGDAATLRSLGEHPHAQVRVEVVRALRAMARDPIACEIVATRLSDPATEVAQAAIASLATMELPPNVVAALETFANDEARSDDARRGAVQVLGRSRNDAAPDALVRLLQPRGLMERPATTALREEAARALRTSPAPSAQARFDEALHSTAWRVRKICERVMEQGQPHGG
jgi:hypothetical protein